MSSNDLKRAKRRVRREVLAIRDAVPEEERAAMGEAIADRFVGLDEVTAGASILVFWSFGSEVPTGPLIDRLIGLGVDVALPRIVDRNLEVVRFRPGDPTRRTGFGAEEPVGGVTIPPDALAVIAVPGVAFDRRGRRVGYGGGYYDRLLPATAATPIAIAFSVQIVDADLPAGGSDIPVAAIVTEAETIRVST